MGVPPAERAPTLSEYVRVATSGRAQAERPTAGLLLGSRPTSRRGARLTATLGGKAISLHRLFFLLGQDKCVILDLWSAPSSCFQPNHADN